MQRENYLVLRASRETGDAVLGVPTTSGGFIAMDASDVSAIRVEGAELSAGERLDLARDASVLGLAPVMPLKLVEPVGDPEPVAPAPAGTATWGVRAVGADTSPFTGEGVVVAVLDTGIDAGHEAFAGVNLVEEDFTGEGNGDVHGHGTHCAGTVFGRPVDGQRIGVAPGVKKALIGKVLGKNGGSSEGTVRAIEWALREGAQVISMSLGIDFPSEAERQMQAGLPPRAAVSRALEGYLSNVLLFERLAALVEAMTPGVVLTAASGNESDRPRFAITAGPPAVSHGFLCVGAVMQEPTGLFVAPFSNTGPNVVGPGFGIASAKRGGGLISLKGTSMATPHVAGVLALWAEKLRGETGTVKGRDLASCVIGSATRKGLVPATSHADFGMGLVRAPQE